MMTVGIRLFENPGHSATCVIRWNAGQASVDVRPRSLGVEGLANEVTAWNPAAIAVGAPFGWPSAMANAASRWRPGGRWEATTDGDRWLRRTETVTCHRVYGMPSIPENERIPSHLKPLIIETLKPAMVTWHCSALLDALSRRGAEILTDQVGQPFPADGRVRVVEACPISTMQVWGISRVTCKATGPQAVRREILGSLEKIGADGWITWQGTSRRRCVEWDGALDALMCAMVARAAALGLVHPPAPEDQAVARVEGWIALPVTPSLSDRAAA